MWLFRWFRTLARWLLSLMQIAPAVALLVAILVDEGPSGEARASPHLFALVLWLFDDFAWACVRNSVVFALLVSVTSLLLGLALRCALARQGAWGQRAFGAALLLVSTASPAFLALGLRGLLGEPQRWPWPFSPIDAGGAGASLESWSGVPLWLTWIWSTLPAGTALVALATESSFRRLDPAWDEAARLAGAGTSRIVRNLFWPIVRPAAARAAGLVFLLALVEPGAPLILGLRRTLAFQIASAADQRSPFPRMAVWALMAALLGLSGWVAFRWMGGQPILAEPVEEMSSSGSGRQPRRYSRVNVTLAALPLGLWAIVAWLPIFGLVPAAFGEGRLASGIVTANGRPAGAIARFSDPMVVQVVLDSAQFGLAVAVGALFLAWAAGLDSRPWYGRMWWRWLRPIAVRPPLVLGAGVLALPWLLGLASRFLLDREQTRLAILLEDFSSALGPRERPRLLMACCVGLALLPRLARNGRTAVTVGPGDAAFDPGYDAAILSGAARWQAWLLKRPLRPLHVLGRFGLFWAFAATNLAPALLFSTGGEGQIIGPAILDLAGGDALSRSRAAALALTAIVVNLAAIAAARGTAVAPFRCEPIT
jgi:ABC-type Fe3+ transport system permease subunit